MSYIPEPPEQDEDEALALKLAREESCKGKTRCPKMICYWPQCGGGPDLMYTTNIHIPRRR